MTDRRPSSVLLTAESIQARVVELAAQIRADYPDNVHIIAVLKGAFIFMSDLIRHMDGSVFPLTNGMWFWCVLIALSGWTLVQKHGEPGRVAPRAA